MIDRTMQTGFYNDSFTMLDGWIGKSGAAEVRIYATSTQRHSQIIGEIAPRVALITSASAMPY